MKNSSGIKEVRLDQRHGVVDAGHWELDLSSGIAWVTGEGFRLYGLMPVASRMTLEEFHRHVPEKDRRRLDRALKHLLENNEKFDLDFTVNTYPPRLIHTVAELENNEAGLPSRVIGIMEDVTDNKAQARKLAEHMKRLLTSENRLKRQSEYNAILSNLLETSAQAFTFTAANGKILRHNQAFCNLVGYSSDELNKILWNENLTPPEWLEYEETYLTQVRLTGIPVRYEKEYIHKDGHRFPVELLVHYYPADNERDAFYYGFVTDITQRKNKEAQAKAAREELARLVDERTAELQEAYRRLVREIEDHQKTGQALNTIMENIGDAFFALDAQWRIAYLNQEAANAMAGGSKEAVLGHSIWELNPQLLGSKFEQEFRQAMADQQPRHFAGYGTRNRDVYFEIYVSPYKDGIAVYYQDATEKKKIEEEMARLDRLNMVGQMSAGISHEIRNPMTTVRGFLQILAAKEAYSGEKEIFNLMISELDRANDILSEYLSLAQNKAINLKRQDLNALIEKLIPLLAANAITEDKYVEFSKGEIPQVFLDSNEIRQLVLNLARNGLEAMAPKKGLFIRTFQDQGEVVLEIRDQGKGIAPEIMAKLGTPFFTTKDQGTGLGLAICYSIVNRHRARMDVRSSPEGTAFQVRFAIEFPPEEGKAGEENEVNG